MRLYRNDVEAQLRKPPEESRRPYFQATTRFISSAVIGTALAFGVVGTTSTVLLTPRMAMAQELTVAGIKVETLRLRDTIDKMDEDTKQYRLYEGPIPNGAPYNNVLQIPQTCEITFVLSEKVAGIIFRFPDGTRKGMDVGEFIKAVERHSRQKVARIQMLVGIGSDPETKEKIITVYALPLNSNRQRIGEYEGGYLATAGSYYTASKELYGGPSLVLEPGVQEPLARR